MDIFIADRLPPINCERSARETNYILAAEVIKITVKIYVPQEPSRHPQTRKDPFGFRCRCTAVPTSSRHAIFHICHVREFVIAPAFHDRRFSLAPCDVVANACILYICSFTAWVHHTAPCAAQNQWPVVVVVVWKSRAWQEAIQVFHIMEKFTKFIGTYFARKI